MGRLLLLGLGGLLCITVPGSTVGESRRQDGQQPFRWLATWDAESGEDSLRLITTVTDGLVERVTMAGSPAIRTEGNYLYFAVADEFLYQVGMDLTLTVELFDEAPASLWVTYDGVSNGQRVSYMNSPSVPLAGSREWKRVALRMPAAYLANGENQGADMRLVFTGPQLPIRRLELTVDGLAETVGYPSVEAMQQARRDLKLQQAVERGQRFLAQNREPAEQLAQTLAEADEPIQPALDPVLQAAQQSLEQLERDLNEAAPFREEAGLEAFIKGLERSGEIAGNGLAMVEQRLAISDFIAQFGKDQHDWLFFTRSASDNFQIVLPWTLPAAAETNAPIRLQLCRGEYEPYTLGLLSRVPVRGVTLTPSDLVAPGGVRIPAGRVDVRIVKRWYQAGRGVETMGAKQLVPEMLLYDDSLVRTDLIRRENLLRFADVPRDADHLLPFDLEPCYTKLMWLTVHAPADAPAGIYRGSIRVTGDSLPPLVIPLQVQILPFELADNPKIASMYYSLQVPAEGGPERLKYRRLLINMREHGLTNPMLPLRSEEETRQELEIRREIGLNKGPLLTIGGYSVPGFLSDSAPREEKERKLRATVDYVAGLAQEYGYDGAYIYAIDEAAGEELRREVPVFQLLEEWGVAGAMAAVLSDFGEVALRDLQLPNYSGFPSREVVEGVHAAGHKIMRYGSPQGGAEDFWLWRYAFGLALWELDLDGGCTWTYRGPIGDPWDDFDGNGTYRDFMMTYPGADHPIDTVQWEGYREANDDLRYMATLEQSLARARQAGAHPELVAEVETWLARRHERPFWGDNLDAVRERMVQYVLQLAP